MTSAEVMKELEAMGDERTKTTLIKHGAKEPFFGVKVADLKKILKKTKKDHLLSLALYKTGNSDAMYLAGLMADESKITKANLETWVKGAYWYYLSEFTVPWVAAESPYGIELGLEWMDSKKETIAAAGWATMAWCAAVMEDDKLDLDIYRKLLKKAEVSVHGPKNRVSFAINNFVIYTGMYIKELTPLALEVGRKIGKVDVQMEGTSCKVPLANAQIQNAIDKGRAWKKRKVARC